MFEAALSNRLLSLALILQMFARMKHKMDEDTPSGLSAKRKVSACSRCSSTPGMEAYATGHISRSSSCPSKRKALDDPSEAQMDVPTVSRENE